MVDGSGKRTTSTINEASRTVSSPPARARSLRREASHSATASGPAKTASHHSAAGPVSTRVIRPAASEASP